MAPLSQSQSNPKGKEPSRDKEPSQDLEDSSEGEEDHEDPQLDQGNPDLDQLMLTAEEQCDLDSFDLASPSVSLPRGKTPLWKVSQENPKFYSQAQPQA